ncbi:hypothetical protein GSI_00904 [Ganoderma sinense ZZ0214-1]|uniref:Uncharacterized protein n=1 Tax=Ganoderma sinense ZZ0214-1 TaxID=1077348 RepID=A0A2G8STV7_9APHY|nr:hypothetical protein GSI_00904 [Ganoderma sinense ZZ0214-1]
MDQTTRKQRHATLIPTRRDASIQVRFPQSNPRTSATLDARRRMRRVPSRSRSVQFARWSSTPPHVSVPTRPPFLLLQLCSPIRTVFGATDAKRRHMTRSFPPGSFSRSQSWVSQAKSDTTADYVEDSEPEREERRLQAAKTRWVKRKNTPVVVVPKPAQDVIELTDTSPSRPSTPAPRPMRIQLAPLVIIDVSDGEESSAGPDPPRGRSREGSSGHVVVNGLGIEISGDDTLEDSLPSIRRVLGLPKASNQKPSDFAPLPTSTRTSPELSENESDAGSDSGKLKLGRFAYAAPNPLRRTASKTPSPIERDSQTPGVTSGVKRTVTPTHRFAEDFTDAQLSRLLKCVSCELAWTARKTVKEKMKHIQSCAKKNRLTDETVRILLRTELAKLPPVASSSKSKTTAESSAPSTSETLLEETLKDKRRKRSGPRKQVEQTVKNVSETRDSILDKARLLLKNVHDDALIRSVSQQLGESSTSSTCAGSAMHPATQAFTRSNVAVRNALPGIQLADTTQVFSSSGLSVARIEGGIVNAGAAIAGESDISPLTQVFTRSALASAMAEVDPSDDMFPATQVFAPSKLTNGAGLTRTVVTTNDGTMHEAISLHDTSEDELDLSKSSPARPSVIDISSSPSSNANLLPPLATPTSPRAAATAPAALDLRSPSPLARRSPLPAGDDGSPAYYGGDGGMDFGVRDGYEYQWNDWADERNLWDEYGGGGDAFLHYDPEADAELLTRSGSGSGSNVTPPGSPQSSGPPRGLLAAIPEDEVPVAGPSRTRDQPIPASREPVMKKKRGRPRKVATDESDAESGVAAGKDISQEDLNARLKEAILKDEVLHLRILRYEPIHFDVFMQLAAENGVTEKKTRLKSKQSTLMAIQ